MSAGEEFNETIPVREAHLLDEATLAKYLGDHMDGFGPEMELRQFAGGESNPTYHLASNGVEYVLRKKPPGKLLPSAHQVEREYRVMKALQDSDVPVPRMLLLCADESIVGTSFFVMEKVAGRVLTNPLLPELSRAERSALYDNFAGVLAALHSVDYGAVGLEDFGRVGGYVERQISRWSKQYLASKTEDIEAMDKLMAWLPENLPRDDTTTLVHGDYRIGNIIIHPDEARFVAVIDWELGTLGHPLSDLAYCCLGYHGEIASAEGHLYGQDLDALGIPDESSFVARYCELTGRDEIENWPFYIAFSLFRVAAIIQGVYKRGLDGISSSTRATQFGHLCRVRAETAWQLVEQSR